MLVCYISYVFICFLSARFCLIINFSDFLFFVSLFSVPLSLVCRVFSYLGSLSLFTMKIHLYLALLASGAATLPQQIRSRQRVWWLRNIELSCPAPSLLGSHCRFWPYSALIASSGRTRLSLPAPAVISFHCWLRPWLASCRIRPNSVLIAGFGPDWLHVASGRTRLSLLASALIGFLPPLAELGSHCWLRNTKLFSPPPALLGSHCWLGTSSEAKDEE